MPTPRKIPCLPCKESHVRCDGERPICQRCRSKKLECRRLSKTTRFIRSSESSFANDQKWVSSRAKRILFDSAVPAGDADSSLVLDLDLDRNASSSSPEDPVSARPDSRNQPVDDSLPSADPLQALADAASGPSPTALNPSWNSYMPWANDRILALPSVAGQDVDRMAPPPAAFANGGTPLGVEDVHPAIAATKANRPGIHRRFPLQDFKEACLMKYYLDEVSCWIDIADPDRHCELVIPLIARSRPQILNAIFALSARHFLSAPRTRLPRDKFWYIDQLVAHITPLSVIEYVQECIPALHLFDQVSTHDELETILVVAVFLRQVELLEKDFGVESSTDGTGASMAKRRAQTSYVRQGVAEASTGSQTFLPIINDILHSPRFKASFPHSGLVQAVYLLAIRQELYYSLASRLCPAITTTRCSPDISFIHETTLHMIEVLQLCWGGSRDPDWDRLFRQQDHLEENTLVGIQPIFYRDADASRGEVLPVIWLNSRTEMYCIQLAKMARAILTFECHMASGRIPSAMERARQLVLEIHGIAADRSESPQGQFHAFAMATLYRDLFAAGVDTRAVDGAADRLGRVPVWPYKSVADCTSGRTVW